MNPMKTLEGGVSSELNLFGMPVKGLNRYFVGTSVIGATVGALHGGVNFMNNAWDYAPDKFQQLGIDAGHTFGEASMAGMGAIMAIQHARTYGASEGAVLNGTTYKKLAAGGWQSLNKDAAHISEETMKNHMSKTPKNAFKVNIKGGSPYVKDALGGTYRPMGMKGNAIMMAGQMVGAIGMGMALNFAGKVLDSAYNESKHFRRPHYDNRFFNTRQFDQSTYQQLGSAMDSYENKMMSVARIYHSR